MVASLCLNYDDDLSYGHTILPSHGPSAEYRHAPVFVVYPLRTLWTVVPRKETSQGEQTQCPWNIRITRPLFKRNCGPLPYPYGWIDFCPSVPHMAPGFGFPSITGLADSMISGYDLPRI